MILLIAPVFIKLDQQQNLILGTTFVVGGEYFVVKWCSCAMCEINSHEINHLNMKAVIMVNTPPPPPQEAVFFFCLFVLQPNTWRIVIQAIHRRSTTEMRG